jgi:hypothetical protein
MEIRLIHYPAALIQGARNCDPTNDMGRSKTGTQNVHVPHPVEHGHNHAPLSDIAAEVPDRGIELISLDCQEDEIELARRLARRDRLDSYPGLRALTDYRQPVRQLGGAPPADEEGHVSSRSRKAAAKKKPRLLRLSTLS